MKVLPLRLLLAASLLFMGCGADSGPGVSSATLRRVPLKHPQPALKR